MNYKDITLNPIEKKILKLYLRYNIDPTFENLEGYLKFPSYDELYSAVEKLKDLGFFHEYTPYDSPRYSITDSGKRYRIYRVEVFKNRAIAAITSIVISIIAGIILSLINKG